MAVRIGSRIEVRLDDEYRAKLEKIMSGRDDTVSDFIRSRIDACFTELELEEIAATIRSLQASAPELPPWEVLKKETARHRSGGEVDDLSESA